MKAIAPKLEMTDPLLQKAFRVITGHSYKEKKIEMKAQMILNHLLKRYPAKIANKMLTHLRLEGTGDFEDFVRMMNRTISMSNEK